MIDEIIQKVFNNFDFTFILIVNVLTYILINIVDYLNGAKVVSTFTKRVLLVCSIVIIAGCYLYIGDYENKLVLLNSSIVSPVSWSWIIKPICKKYNIDYKSLVKNGE